jgi:hypothetical protein
VSDGKLVPESEWGTVVLRTRGRIEEVRLNIDQLIRSESRLMCENRSREEETLCSDIERIQAQLRWGIRELQGLVLSLEEQRLQRHVKEQGDG